MPTSERDHYMIGEILEICLRGFRYNLSQKKSKGLNEACFFNQDIPKHTVKPTENGF